MTGLCEGQPPEFWETGDDGNRLALAICRVCPERDGTECMAGMPDPHPHGVIRAAVAYAERGKVARICGCGYPDDKLPDPRRTTVLCRRCEVPQVRAWRQDRRRYWADYYRRRKTEMEAARSGADLGDVLAGVASPAGDLGLGHAPGDGLSDGGVQLDAPLVEDFLGAPERPGGLFEGVRHVAECDTG